MCDVTNRAIRDLLKEQVPQVTFTCKADTKECDFQCELLSFLVFILTANPFL